MKEGQDTMNREEFNKLIEARRKAHDEPIAEIIKELANLEKCINEAEAKQEKAVAAGDFKTYEKERGYADYVAKRTAILEKQKKELEAMPVLTAEEVLQCNELMFETWSDALSMYYLEVVKHYGNMKAAADDFRRVMLQLDAMREMMIRDGNVDRESVRTFMNADGVNKAIADMKPAIDHAGSVLAKRTTKAESRKQA